MPLNRHIFIFLAFQTCRRRSYVFLLSGQGIFINTVVLLFVYRFTFYSRIFHLYPWWRHHCRWKAAKFRPMLGAQGHWAGRDLYCAKPVVTRDLGFPVSSEGPPHSVASYDTQGDVEDLFLPGSSWIYCWCLHFFFYLLLVSLTSWWLPLSGQL
jgi:hypothetical protein